MAQPRTRSQRSRLLALLIGCLVAFAGSGCATIERHGACALVGAGVGAAGGVIYAVNDNSLSIGETMGIAVGTTAVGALLGYGACVVTDMVQK